EGVVAPELLVRLDEDVARVGVAARVVARDDVVPGDEAAVGAGSLLRERQRCDREDRQGSGSLHRVSPPVARPAPNSGGASRATARAPNSPAQRAFVG